ATALPGTPKHREGGCRRAGVIASAPRHSLPAVATALQAGRAATAANQKRLTEAKEVSSFTPNSGFVLFVTFCETPSPIAFEHIFEGSVKICVERIRPIGVCRQIAPVLVHPEPGRRVSSGVWFKGIPTRLCDLLMSHFSGALDLWMEDYPVASIRQRLAMRWDNRDAGLRMEPGVRGSDAGF